MSYLHVQTSQPVDPKSFEPKQQFQLGAGQLGAQGPSPVDTIMTNGIRHARMTAEELASACNRLEALKERLFGHEPAPPNGTVNAVPQPQGAVYELNVELDRHHALTVRLGGIITDLERLA